MVDPIDGTSNYAAGLPLFGVMAAVMVRGEVVAAAIHDPIGDDTALALRGEGAWTETAGWPEGDLRVAARGPRGEDDRQRVVAVPAGAAAGRCVCANLPRVGGSWDYRCAAHEYRLAAAGTAISCSSTGCCRGTMRLAGCCIRRPAAIRRGWTAAIIARR